MTIDIHVHPAFYAPINEDPAREELRHRELDIHKNGTAPLELFFLDEGFGSLDDDLLDVVMTSLERLPNKRRSIGIITHVEAIQSRVPVKLIVTPSDISQNGSSIRLEYS